MRSRRIEEKKCCSLCRRRWLDVRCQRLSDHNSYQLQIGRRLDPAKRASTAPYRACSCERFSCGLAPICDAARPRNVALSVVSACSFHLRISSPCRPGGQKDADYEVRVLLAACMRHLAAAVSEIMNSNACRIPDPVQASITPTMPL